MTTNDLDLTSDIIDVRDIIEHFEELEEQEPDADGSRDWADYATYETLHTILDELKGNGGDEKWRGNWYPVTLIRDSYFTEYARDLLQHIGDIPKQLVHYIEIDWEITARNIRVDYSSIEIDGITYWYR